MNSDPIAALEIGTSRTVLAIGEPIAPGRVRVAALAAIPSSGVRKSRITDIGQAGVSVASVVKRAEAEGHFRIGQVVLAVNGPQVSVRKYVTKAEIEGPVVTENDMTELYNRSVDAEKSEAPHVLLDRTDVCWDLDDLKGITSPKGMSGKALALHALVVEGSPERLNDTKAACEAAGVSVADSFFAGACAAQAVLTPADRAAGTLVIDLGGGSTCWTVTCDGKTVHAGVLGVGGNHLINDVRHAFSVSRAQATELIRAASAVIAPDRATGRVELPKVLTALRTDSVSRRALDTVVNARMAETFSIVRADLESVGILHRLNGGCILTGGGAYLPEVNALAASVFGCATRTGALIPEIEGLEKEPEPAALATVAGLILVAHANTPDENGLIGSLFNSFGKVFNR